MSESREITTEEATESFLQHVRGMIRYWDEPNLDLGSQRERLEGLAFSIMGLLDGVTMSTPQWIVAPNPHRDDKEFQKNEGVNWWPENDPTTVACNISGGLHELLAAKS